MFPTSASLASVTLRTCRFRNSFATGRGRWPRSSIVRCRMVNAFFDKTNQLLGEVDKFSDEIGMMGVQMQLLHAAGLFAIATALQDNANVQREALEYRKRSERADNMENHK